MSEINYQALREVAERAIPAMERLLMLPADDDLLSEQELKDYGVDIDALNAFKFLTGPETIRLLEWATGDSLLVSRELFQLRIYHLAGGYFTLLTEEYGKYMGGPRVIAVGVILTISHLLEISRLNAITCYLH
ncbi:hypothetical protein G6O30_003097 [Shigella dysenteriae]|nr:ead/Ea22-like family protein [Escherichia coli]EFP6926700.1 hypothetical protein [Shigella dysenteriae]EFO4699961.1 ead/Ea22-like family protein [Escherichia coli]EFP8427223.1 hypothetical protein [Shigella dysenteriae]EFP8850780.1 hypothetical protein [Shigella dysenteriae]